VSDRIRVTAAIIIENQKVLITQRHPNDVMSGKWEFPGGKIEPGETPEICLRRELQEELGILTRLSCWHIRPLSEPGRLRFMSIAMRVGHQFMT
jgi:mutator protein MutT